MMRNKDGTPEFSVRNLALGAGNVLSRRKNSILEYLGDRSGEAKSGWT